MFWVQLVVMFAVIFVVCMVALGGDGGIGRVFPDRPDVAMPRDRLMARPDVEGLRFSTGVRGYRMDEVDNVLDRLSDELQVRDDYIAELRAELAADTPGRPAWVTAAPGGATTLPQAAGHPVRPADAASGPSPVAAARPDEPEPAPSGPPPVSRPERDAAPGATAGAVRPGLLDPAAVPTAPTTADEPPEQAGQARDTSARGLPAVGAEPSGGSEPRRP